MPETEKMVEIEISPEKITITVAGLRKPCYTKPLREGEKVKVIHKKMTLYITSIQDLKDKDNFVLAPQK